MTQLQNGFTKTPTPEFQNLLNTKSKEEISYIFLDHLKANYPIPEDVKVTVTFTNRSKVTKGNNISATVVQDRKERTSEITMYKTKTTDITELLSTIAHEYKHVLQNFVEGYPWLPGHHYDMKKEVAAGVFGVFKSRMFCYGW